MPEYRIVAATEEHALALAPIVRRADAEEVWAASRSTPEEALLRGLEYSLDPRAGLVDGTVACVFGVGQVTLASDWGIPWMLASPEVERHARAFLRLNLAYVREIRGQYRVLLNFVDARNTMALRWLRWLGFRVLPAVPFGADDLPFHPFNMRS